MGKYQKTHPKLLAPLALSEDKFTGKEKGKPHFWQNQSSVFLHFDIYIADVCVESEECISHEELILHGVISTCISLSSSVNTLYATLDSSKIMRHYFTIM